MGSSERSFEYGCEQWRGDSTIAPFGIANLLVEALHNFGDGLALGVAFSASVEAGLATAVAVAVHELPQELGDCAVLRRAGFSTRGILAANFVNTHTHTQTRRLERESDLPLKGFFLSRNHFFFSAELFGRAHRALHAVAGREPVVVRRRRARELARARGRALPPRRHRRRPTTGRD